MSEVENMQLSPEDLLNLREIECIYLNVEEAKNFISTCSDPIDREIMWTAYATLTFRMVNLHPSGKFDVLFFAQVLLEVLSNKDHLRHVLSGKGDGN